MNPALKQFFSRLRILPILIIVATLAFIVRIGDAVVGFSSLSAAAHAEEVAEQAKEVHAKPASPEPKEAGAEAGQTQPSLDSLADAKKDSGAGEKTDTPPSSKDEKWKDASEADTDYADIKQEIYQDLTKRREEIDLRERKLGEREALLEAAQKELDRKYKELEGLRDELKGLLKQQTAEEAARIESLVKIYASMKPKDAARIFDTLDTEILMDVISGMPEAKASPIMALMNADRAKSLTTLLAEQKKLPDVQ